MNNSPKISHFTVIVIFICLAIAGLALIPTLPIKLEPSRTLPVMNVWFSMPNHSGRVVEMEVTSKLEAMLARIKGINEIESTSGDGWGQITLSFDKHTDVDVARFEASSIIRQTWPSLPSGVRYPSIQMRRPDDGTTGPFMTYTLNAAATPIYIQRYAEENIKTRLSQIPGVFKVDISGATPMEWRLEYDNRKLSSLGLSNRDIVSAVNGYYSREFLGTADYETGSGDEWIRLAIVPQANNTEFHPEDIFLTTRDGKLIPLDQLISVRRMEQEPTGYYRINGLNSIYMNIYADDMANQLTLNEQVQAEMGHIRENLPPGYEIHLNYNTTDHINKELNKIYYRTTLTILILLTFVLIITRNFYYLLLIVISVTINLAIGVIFYYLLKLEIQIYSLAGITISLSLIIDNTIVMTDHIRTHNNKGAILPIIAATLTTIGALAIIFFLDEKIRLNLQDFAAVVIINLAVSLLIALFLVPALIEKIGVMKTKNTRKRFLSLRRFVNARVPKRKRLLVYFTHFYEGMIRVLCRWRVLVCIMLVLAFGLPVFMLPAKIEKKADKTYSTFVSGCIDQYNKLMSNATYKEKVKPVVEKALGGTLRLFVQKVFDGSYYGDNRNEVSIRVTATLPNGSTLDQMNNLIKRMEAFLTTQKEIRQFHTRISSAYQASISIYFTPESEHTGYPYMLKSQIIEKALELSGGSWGVYGLQDQGFNNDVRESAGNYQVQVFGYNYDELYSYAEVLRDSLLANRRIRDVLINSEFSWYKENYQEFFFDLNKQTLIEEDIRPIQLFNSLQSLFNKDQLIASITVDNESEALKLSSRQYNEYDRWNLMNISQPISGRQAKLSNLATVKMGQTPKTVKKINQQYRLCLQYDYIGAGNQGRKILDTKLEEFNKKLPVGYSAISETSRWYWTNKDKGQYLLLVLIIVIIFFTTSILFNSLKRPLAIIFIIPVSYIGVFLTFYLFKLNFDQGGFASFVLLCGITINASIYIMYEYIQIMKRNPRLPQLRAYVKAWNAKITPIFLTIVSTVLGFIPFMVGTQKEGFWFPLAAGTIGGLIMSFIGIFLFLPIFTLKKRHKIKK